MNETGAGIGSVARNGGSGESILLRPLTLGIATAVIFVVLASIRLTAQGVNQDELHQAAGAFAWRGGPLLNYAEMTVRGLPVLNMSYSGAIKTALYGLYLRYSGRGFSVLSWRSLGILIGGLALLAFYLLAGRRWPPLARLVFALLVLSDPNLLLLQRHDYGPVAIAFFLRMLFLGFWLRQIDSPSGGVSSCFWLGVIAGIAAFEKLSSLVLLLPLSLAILTPLRRTPARQRVVVAGLGALLGFLPLIAVNL